MSHQQADGSIDEAMEDDSPSVTEETAKKVEQQKEALPAKTSSRSRADMQKCSQCKKKLARQGCSGEACLNCCTDADCPGHKEARETSKWKEDVLNGTTQVNQTAAKKRATATRSGAFREKAFIYMGQTVCIWNIREFEANPKWREDAIRRSEKRRARLGSVRKKIGNSRKRFHELIERKYRESIESKSMEEAS